MPPQRRFHFWMTYVNGKGTRYGASLDNGTGVHVRGSDAGVRVTPHGADGNYGPGPAHTDTFVVAMTRGDGDDSEPVVLGTVTSTPGGPRWEPADLPGRTYICAGSGECRAPEGNEHHAHHCPRYTMP